MNSRKIFFGILTLILVSCSKEADQDEPSKPSLGAFEKGIFAVNQGTYSDFRGSLDFLPDNLEKIDLNVYFKTNNEEIGDVLRDFKIHGDLIYTLFNSSRKINISNRYTLKKVAEIKDEFVSPKFMHITDKYIYVSDDQPFGGENFVIIYDLKTYKFIKKISIPDGAYSLAMAGNNLFVLNAESFLSNKISLIDMNSNTLKGPINLTEGETHELISYDDKIYAITRSDKNDSYLYTISNQGEILKKTQLKGITGPNNLRIHNSKVYFSQKTEVYVMDLNSTTVPKNPLFIWNGNNLPHQYFDAFNIIDDKIFVAIGSQVKDYSDIQVYDLSGKLIKKFISGRATIMFVKNLYK